MAGLVADAEHQERAARSAEPYEGRRRQPARRAALYLGSTLYRIHGTNEPWKIGDAVSSGCIRLTNDDIIDLYNRVKIGASVIVQR